MIQKSIEGDSSFCPGKTATSAKGGGTFDQMVSMVLKNQFPTTAAGKFKTTNCIFFHYQFIRKCTILSYSLHEQS